MNFTRFFRLPTLLLVVLSILALMLAAPASAAEETVIPPVQQALDWKAIAGGTLLTVLQVVGTGIATLLGAALLWVCRAIAGKFNVQMSAEQDAQVYAAAEKAVAYAEEWARKEFVKPTGSEKADIALAAVREVLDSKTYKEYGEPALRKLIDAAVAKLRAEKAATDATLPPAP